MFEKVGRIAEEMATNASRRQLLGRFGRAALAAAAAVGGILALPDVAQAQGGVCGPQSSLGCIGMPFNSRCRRGHFTGICRSFSGTCVCQ